MIIGESEGEVEPFKTIEQQSTEEIILEQTPALTHQEQRVQPIQKRNIEHIELVPYCCKHLSQKSK